MEYRLYFFVPYNISDIQKGIQAGHAALEYAFMYRSDKEYRQFIAFDRTWIVLNGGTTRYDKDKKGHSGSLNEIAQGLLGNGIKFATFEEPDLNNALSAICFLADERVWDKEKYPDYIEPEPLPSGYSYVIPQPSYEDWKESMGDKNIFLRELLKDKHLA